ncbi:GEL complex subunit OPTI [Chironomus tepperi]|uniref:GEL complex subunit OPTI n=1 Tax=Chironomus tepperi TaxID=113505 RepID=UPI00391F9713
MASKQSTVDKSKPINVSFSALMKMGLSSKTEWPDTEIFLDWIYWSRQIVGLFLGLIWGVIPLTGFIGLIAFGLCSSGYVYLYCTTHNIDDEEHGGIWEIVKEGFMTNFASFLVTWIITYSCMHFDESLTAQQL